MVQIVPNRSLVEGKIVSIRKSPDIDHFSVMEILPVRISETGSLNSLVKTTPGETLHVHIANDVQKKHGLREGSNISTMVRKAPQNLFAIPDSVKVL